MHGKETKRKAPGLHLDPKLAGVSLTAIDRARPCYMEVGRTSGVGCDELGAAGICAVAGR